MPKQPAFPGLKHAMKKKQTRRELFLAVDLHRFCSGQVLMLGGLLFEGDG